MTRESRKGASPGGAAGTTSGPLGAGRSAGGEAEAFTGRAPSSTAKPRRKPLGALLVFRLVRHQPDEDARHFGLLRGLELLIEPDAAGVDDLRSAEAAFAVHPVAHGGPHVGAAFGQVDALDVVVAGRRVHRAGQGVALVRDLDVSRLRPAV